MSKRHQVNKKIFYLGAIIIIIGIVLFALYRMFVTQPSINKINVKTVAPANENKRFKLKQDLQNIYNNNQSVKNYLDTQKNTNENTIKQIR